MPVLPERCCKGSNGNIYGTTFSGGTKDMGSVFKMTLSGKVTTLYSFGTQKGCSDGQSPVAALIQTTTDSSTAPPLRAVARAAASVLSSGSRTRANSQPCTPLPRTMAQTRQHRWCRLPTAISMEQPQPAMGRLLVAQSFKSPEGCLHQPGHLQ